MCVVPTQPSMLTSCRRATADHADAATTGTIAQGHAAHVPVCTAGPVAYPASAQGGSHRRGVRQEAQDHPGGVLQRQGPGRGMFALVRASAMANVMSFARGVLLTEAFFEARQPPLAMHCFFECGVYCQCLDLVSFVCRSFVVTVLLVDAGRDVRKRVPGTRASQAACLHARGGCGQ